MENVECPDSSARSFGRMMGAAQWGGAGEQLRRFELSSAYGTHLFVLFSLDVFQSAIDAQRARLFILLVSSNGIVRSRRAVLVRNLGLEMEACNLMGSDERSNRVRQGLRTPTSIGLHQANAPSNKRDRIRNTRLPRKLDSRIH